MDPATIIGTTSAILSFVQFTGKVISTTIAIRNNAGQATDSNQALDATVKGFNSRLAKLRSRMPAQPSRYSEVLTADDDAQASLLLSLAKCEDLGSKIQKLLDKIGAQKMDQTGSSVSKSRFWKVIHRTPENNPSTVLVKTSLPEAFKASLKSFWMEKDIKSLREQWENCVKDFNINFMRLDTQTRFKALQQVSDESSATLNALQGNLQTLVMDCKDANLKALGSFLDDYVRDNSNAAKEKRNFEHLLKLLEFPGMDSRRDQVHNAARDTFEWLLCEDSIPKWHDELEMSPRQWLATGSGVYHITGKPGSGKSTLTKLIEESSESREQLQKWANWGQKQLINASFFVWRAADSNQLQNRVEGMLRTLLHQILTEEPGLISRVFPEHWHPERFHSNSPLIGRILQLGEIEDALERIFGFPDLLGPYRIFLLIDGLDEFDDDHEAHFLIAKRVKDWCEGNPDNVKACVSSREENPFVNSFLAHQRLRLHLITHAAIWRLTEQRLMVHPHFASCYFTKEQRERLIDSISDKAEGVFLWAVLTVAELTHCLDGNQDFKALCRVVDQGNKNLEKFFEEILSRIPDVYREDSQALFRIVQFTTRDYFGFCLFHVYKAVEYAKATHHLAETVGNLVSQEDAVDELKLFKSRLPIITRGLLELERDRNTTSALAGPHGLYKLSFIHRSVFDFFQGDPKHIWGDNLADNDSYVVRLIIQSSIQIVNTLNHDSSYWHWRRFIYGVFAWFGRIKDRKAVTVSDFACLKALDAALLRKQGILPDGIQFDSSQWTDVRLPHWRESLDDVPSISLEACKWNLERRSFRDEFVSWALKGGYPNWIRNPTWKARFARDLLLGPGELFQPDLKGLNEEFIGVNEVLDANMLPWQMDFAPPVRGSLWLSYLVHVIFRCALLQCDVSSQPANHSDSAISMMLKEKGPALRAFLSNGAEPYVAFHWWSKGTNAGRDDCHELNADAETRTRTLSSFTFNSSTAMDSTKDSSCAWEEGASNCSDNLHNDQCDMSIGKTVPLADVLLGVDFGLEVTVGATATRQLIQGPKWPRIRDTLLIRFFLSNFGTAIGTVTLTDLWKTLYSIRLNGARPEMKQETVEELNKIIQMIDNATGQDAAAQDALPKSYERSEDQKTRHTPGTEAFVTNGTKAKGSTSLEQMKEFLILTLGGMWRKYKMLMLPVLGVLTGLILGSVVTI